jgi:hypothetical protein
MSVRVAPNDGELLTAATVGSFIRNFGRLMTTIGQTQGAKTEVLVERIKTDEDGAVTATVLVCRRKPLNADGDTP